MELFFDPKSVAVIGASSAPFNLGATICGLLKDYLRYPGTVYAVNSKGEDVNGYPGYASVLDLPEAPDLAIIIVAARHVPGIIKNCARKGIKRIAIRAKHRIPIFETLEQAVRALSVSHTYYESLLKRKFIDSTPRITKTDKGNQTAAEVAL